MADQNIDLNQGCVDYEKQLAVAVEALRKIDNPNGWEHEGRLIYDPQFIAHRTLVLLGVEVPDQFDPEFVSAPSGAVANQCETCIGTGRLCRKKHCSTPRAPGHFCDDCDGTGARRALAATDVPSAGLSPLKGQAGLTITPPSNKD